MRATLPSRARTTASTFAGVALLLGAFLLACLSRADERDFAAHSSAREQVASGEADAPSGRAHTLVEAEHAFARFAHEPFEEEFGDGGASSLLGTGDGAPRAAVRRAPRPPSAPRPASASSRRLPVRGPPRA